MRRCVKNLESAILTEGLRYGQHSARIMQILLAEHKSFCAYTDELITRTDAKDIEHFNPTLKESTDDNYNNWYPVKHQWNMEKKRKWEKYQPILYPTAEDFEERIIYSEGDYLAKPDDIEANNLIKWLKLDDAGLAEKRKRYINRKRSEIQSSGKEAIDYFRLLIEQDKVEYSRAIREEFNVDVLEMLE